MASSKPTAKSGGRWNFISQAVASVEKGLDSILLEDEEKTKKPISQNVSSSSASTSTPSANMPSHATRSNDRLQARLAQAMTKNSRSATPDSISRSHTPVSDSGAPHGSNETTKSTSPNLEINTSSTSGPRFDEQTVENRTESDGQSRSSVDHPRISSDSASLNKDLPRNARSPFARVSSQLSRQSPRPSTEEAVLRVSFEAQSDTDEALLAIQLEHESKQTELRQEMDGYLERIDALQRNIQLLTREAKQRARDTAAAEDASQHEKELAEKDERIASLVEEGSKLSKSELQYRNTIKTLRARNAVLAKEQHAVRERSEKAEKSLIAAQSRATKAESDSRSRDQQIITLTKSVANIEALSKERDALNLTLSDFRSQLNASKKRAEEMESSSISGQATLERRLKTQHEEELESAAIERRLAEDKLRREIEDIKQQLVHEREQARQMETEMLAEQAVLEARLESIRARAEEVSSGDTGDLQAKLLRQVETLQQQYAAASQNWQGIEGTLLARISALEKERDDAISTETDLRRRLRDATTKAKNATRELEEAQTLLSSLEDKQADEEREVRRLRHDNKQLESSLARLQKELEDHKSQTERDFTSRLDEERAKWLASLPPPVTVERLDSAVTSIRKSHASLMSPTERPSSRRPSIQPQFFVDPNHNLSRIASLASIRANGVAYTNGTLAETPSVVSPEAEADDFFNAPPTPASHVTQDDSAGKTRNINDIMSASTLGAGPSIQLVERLSTAVRRLESEKAAFKDELTRLTSQRDEARQEVVNLMREVEAKRRNDEELKQLRDEHKTLTAAHQAMLELLGEKTEQVEELKADVADVKAMYRELVDTLGREK